MKILVVADEECLALWDYYIPGRLKPYDLILSAGDLKASYLSFLVTMARCPVMYIHGNHDGRFESNPPEGCDSIDDKLVVYRGLRILGLGGCQGYSQNQSRYQCTEEKMKQRIRKMKRAIRMVGGVDIVLTHTAPKDVGDLEDAFHRGFDSFLDLIDSYHPKYLLHGHIHLNYGQNIQREREYHGTKVFNCCEKYELDYDFPKEMPKLSWAQRLYCRLFVKNLEFIST